MLDLAQKTNGVIVTNDNLRDLVDESPAWRDIIKKRWASVKYCNISELDYFNQCISVLNKVYLQSFALPSSPIFFIFLFWYNNILLFYFQTLVALDPGAQNQS